ncbi:hypothetical protein [Dysgonomonas mossii]|uniref:hypothetical protein n=1 Tax=Dysgonomonas mossii TaxID=163665 RepID=UPI003992A844
MKKSRLQEPTLSPKGKDREKLSRKLKKRLKFETKTLNGNDYRVLNLLAKGTPLTVVEMCDILKLPDVRSNVRYLRNAGYNISDYWVKSDFSRCKKYFIKTV